MTSKAYILRVRLTESQLNRIKNNAQSKGYKTVSSYIRELALKYDQYTEEMISKIYDKLIKNR